MDCELNAALITGRNQSTKPIRRAGMNMRKGKQIRILYSNIQGFVGKKSSIQDIIQTVDCHVCLLAETMTTNVKLDGMKCITAAKSVGQNVAILLRGIVAGIVPMKLYEPNETLNMLGIRLEVAKNNFKRFYTAHMKQLSTNDREAVRNQFEEIRQQFHQAQICKEGMLLICDANVHVGGAGVPGCADKQDWAGAELLNLIDHEGLYLLNREKVCKGIVTRIDPRNGTKSTLDLAICNEFMISEVKDLVIDEKDQFKPTKYGTKETTKTGHNSIILDLQVKKIANEKGRAFFNTRCEVGQTKFQEEMQNADLDGLFVDKSEMNRDYKKLMKTWNDVLSLSFKKVRRSRGKCKGLDPEIKQLMQEERTVKKDWVEGREKGEKLNCLQAEISQKIAENVEAAMAEKVHKISLSKCPQAEVFKIRRNINRTESMDFPLKDTKGNVRVSKEGIDEVISSHFGQVFNQNPVADGWEEYWNYVTKIYDTISLKETFNIMEGPTFEEIDTIIDNLDKTKSVHGTMSIELVKKAGIKFRKMVHRCVYLCFVSNEIPDEFRIEKMVLLYKHKGKLDELDNYRGIFLRLILLTIYQKWLYVKCAPVVDQHGSETAFGGRKKKSPMNPLLIIKLVQDHARWTKQQIIFKFMDVEKFFDSMNFHKCMIDIHESGVQGSYWKAYETINSHRICVPVIPSGACSEIQMNNVFVQGSCDAVLMAWNHMDTLNKKKTDIWSKKCTIQGIDLDALTFVDDIFEIIKTQYDLLLSSARSEVFQKETRLNFKPPKCKIMVMNQSEEISDELGGIKFQQIDNHEYLGTIISADGCRNTEIDRRISEAKSVSNEIVQILKTTELSRVRLKYVTTLSNSCVDSKVKYGCSVWNELKNVQEKDLNDLKVRLLKRVLELPYSTPSNAVKYEFGLTDLDLGCLMEKVLLANETLKQEGLGSRLLRSMMAMNVPGFCTEVVKALKTFDLTEDSEELMLDGKNLRELLKTKIIQIQSERMVAQMLKESKTDRLLLNGFHFNGKVKEYLVELPFNEARAIFMLRTRMFPTKDNFKGRWGSECMYCGNVESDVHLFSCAGYNDLLGNVNMDLFLSLDATLDELFEGAQKLLKVIERLERFNTSND